MPESNKFIHLKGKELKKVEKIRSRSKKITLVSYKDFLIYYLYDRNSDFIIVSCSVDINEDKMLTKKSNKTANKTLVVTNKIIKTSLLTKTSLATDEITKTLSLITKLAKTLSSIIKLTNLDHIASLVVEDREIMNNPPSRALVSKSRYNRSPKKKTLINKVILVIKILE